MYILFLLIDFILPLFTTKLMFAHALFFYRFSRLGGNSQTSVPFWTVLCLSLITYLLGRFLSSRLHWTGRNFDGYLSLSILYFLWISISTLLHLDIAV